MSDQEQPTPRLLAIMGSGETAPTMIKPHRALFDRFGSGPVRASLLDTPVGFQENADEISEKAVTYFANSVGREVGVVSLKSTTAATAFEIEAALTALRASDWIFAGPGSPTYSLRHWVPVGLGDVLADKLREGGCVVFASAAALTLGVATVPVYEVYKAGEDPFWLEGLDLLSEIGLRVALIPHYDNAEGGHHDTRFCYLGERRLAMLERELPAGVFVLGVDEHTGLVLDLDGGAATVVGRGVVTVRRNGRSRQLPAGTELSIDALAALGVQVGNDDAPESTGCSAPLGGAGSTPGSSAEETPPPGTAEETRPAGTAEETLNNPLLEAALDAERAFAAALASADIETAVNLTLELESEIEAWTTDTNVGPERERARAALRTMVVRLGQLAAVGAQDPAETVGPYVDLLLAERSFARDERRFVDADRIRNSLVAAGVEVRDSAEGTTWTLGT